MKKKQQPDCPLIRMHSIYLWNIHLLNPYEVKLQSSTKLHVEETFLRSKTKLSTVF